MAKVYHDRVTDKEIKEVMITYDCQSVRETANMINRLRGRKGWPFIDHDTLKGRIINLIDRIRDRPEHHGMDVIYKGRRKDDFYVVVHGGSTPWPITDSIERDSTKAGFDALWKQTRKQFERMIKMKKAILEYKERNPTERALLLLQINELEEDVRRIDMLLGVG